MPHYTAVTMNREHRKRAVLLRQDLAFTEIDDIQLTKTTDDEQLTVAIRTDHGDLSHDLRKDNNFKLKLPLSGFDTVSVLVNAVL